MHIASIGIDLGKTTFHLVALGKRNKILLRRKFSRSQLLAYTDNLPASLIGLEACTGSHFIGSVLREQGHQVRLIPAQFVKPYRKSNKNDFIDAEAIAEAVTKQNMRFVQIKTQAQLDWQAMHCVRDRRPDLGSVGGNGSDVCNVVAFFEGWDRVDVQDDTGDGSAGFEYELAEIVGDKADFHALLNIGTTLHKRVPNARAVGQDIHDPVEPDRILDGPRGS